MGLSSNASKEIVSIFIALCLFGVLLLISRASGDKESRGQVLVAKGWILLPLFLHLLYLTESPRKIHIAIALPA